MRGSRIRDWLAPGRMVVSPIEKALYRRGTLDASQLTLPQFLGIGAQKAGTTWLYANLAVHPELFLSRQKELHYFDRRFHRSLRWYARWFEEAGDRVRGEITPAYAMLTARRVEFVRSVMPNVKILWMMRNPIERAWSQAVMMLVRKADREFSDVTTGEFIAFFDRSESLRRSSYLSTLRLWRETFCEEQLFCGFFDDIQLRPRELLSDVFRFLGVTTDLKWSDFPCEEVIHKGVSAPMPAECRRRLEEIYRQDIEDLYEEFGEPVDSWRVS